MSLSMWLVVLAWSLEAVVSSIPWFVQAGPNVVVWARSGLTTIVGLHAAGTVVPVVAAFSLWRQERLIACLSLTGLASGWLFWHILTFTHFAPVLRDRARVLLSVITLGVVLLYSLRQARSGAVADNAGT
jgi:hypothetical protein